MTDNLQLDHYQTPQNLRKFPLSVIADNIEIASNVGSLFRICDALGVETLYLTGSSITPPNHKLRKTSRSTEKYVDFKTQKDAIDIVKQLRFEGYQILCLEITKQSQPIESFNISSDDKICLIIGSENAGISKDLLEIADHTLHIPMHGHNSSMNVATAAAIAIHELTKVFVQDVE